MTDKLKIVLAGCGGMSKAWLEPASKRSDVEIVGLVDLVRKNAEDKADLYKIPHSAIFADLPTALKAAKPDIVFDVTVPVAHPQVTITALQAGCHVLGEKPMAESMAAARKMVATAKKARRVYAVMQNRRYEPNILRAKKVLQEGTLGRVEEVHTDFFKGPHFGGFRDEMAFPLLIDMSIHTFDQARFLSGVEPVAVYCHSFNPKRSWYKGDAAAQAIFEMTKGVVFNYRGSWCAEGLPTDWACTWRLACSQGTLLWEPNNLVRVETIDPAQKAASFYRDVKSVTVPELTLEREGHDALINEFLDFIKARKKPQTHCEDNIKSLAMVHAAVKSAKTGKRVKIEW